jgi:hypothetical protein
MAEFPQRDVQEQEANRHDHSGQASRPDSGIPEIARGSTALSLTPDEQTILKQLIKRGKPLSDTYFRSVERRFMDPSNVLNGFGTEAFGGRFAAIGTKGVYLADSDKGASAEVLARKKRLGNASQISLDKYPRVVFAVDIELERVVSLVRSPRNPTLLLKRRLETTSSAGPNIKTTPSIVRVNVK